jgi:hypothetical protein
MGDIPSILITDSGHVGSQFGEMTADAAIKKLYECATAVRGCPINRNVPTKLMDKTFRRMCLKVRIGKKSLGKLPTGIEIIKKFDNE